LPTLRDFFNDLVRLEIEIWNAVDARLKEDHGLPLTHFEPMSVIDGMGACRVFDIASELGITTGGASKLVDRIEEDGLLRRRPNPDDRRSSLLELTAEGERLLKSAAKSFDDELELRLGSLSERGMSQTASTLARLRAATASIDSLEKPA
jgi:MarR family transcriptional regulator, organic hydroperoxide resistance regulator